MNRSLAGFCFACVCFFFSVSVFAQPYFIEGTVTDSGTALPIEGVQLDFLDSTLSYVGSTATDINGDYSFETPGDDDYYVFTPIFAIPIPYLPDVWDGVDGTYCDFQVCDIGATGTPVTIAGSSVMGIDFALDTGFTISGTVTDASTTNPIDGANVCVHLDTGEWTGSCGGTGGGGGFETFALPPGANYVAYAFADEQGYKRQMWASIDCAFNFCPFDQGTLIELGNPGDATGIDFNLSLAASISGTVTSSASGLGVQPQARLHALNGDQLGAINGAPDGTYTLAGIDPGTYYLLLNNRAGPLIDEVWDNVHCPRLSCDFMTLGTQITIMAGDVLTGYDAALDPGSQISGSVMIDGSPPPAFETLDFFNSAGVRAGFGFVDGAGNYISRSGFPAGTYYVVFGGPDSTIGYPATAWPNVPCGEPCDPTLGDPVVVNGTDEVGGINFNLLSPGTASLSGVVVDAADGTTPVHPVDIDLLDPVTGDPVGVNTTNNPDGSYALFGIVPGDYKIIFNAFEGAEGFIDELFDEIPCDNGGCDRANLGDIITLNAGFNSLDEDLVQGVPGPMISGTVTDSGTALPIEGVQIDFWDSTLSYVGSTATDINGDYSFETPGDDDYYVFTPIFAIPIPYLPDVWDGVDGTYCDFQVCDIGATGTPVTIAGSSVMGIDFALDTGFTISGTVTDASTTNPIDGASICIHLDTFPWTGACGGTNASGNYQTSALPAGTNYVAYAAADDQNYQSQVWSGIDCNVNNCFAVFDQGTLIELGNPGNATGIDFNLSLAASITGTVTSSASGLGVQPQARLHALNGDQLGGITGAPDGTYRISGISPGTYYLLLNNRAGPLIDEVWDNVQCPRLSCDFMTLGTQINVTAGEMLTGYDAALDPGSQISGSVMIDGSPPPAFETLDFFNSAGVRAGFAFVDGAGNYISRSGFPAGTYYVVFGGPDSTIGYPATAWPNVPCGEPCDPTLGDPVVVNGTDEVGGINFNLLSPGTASLSGVVVDAADGTTPVHPVDIDLLDPVTGDPVGVNTTNNPDGTYALFGAAPGDYKIIFNAFGDAEVFADELFDEIPCDNGGCDRANLGDIITLNAGFNSLDEDLVQGVPSPMISGTVTDSGTALPIEGVQVDFWDSTLSYVGSTATDINGDYSFETPGDDDYYVFTPIYGIPIPYLPDVWDGVDGTYCDFRICDIGATGTPVTIAGSSVMGIDLALDTGFTISGNVIDASTTNPIDGALVCIFLDTSAWTGACGNSDPMGNYQTSALPTGANYVAYGSADGQNYKRQIWSGLDCDFNNCTAAFDQGTLIELGNPGDATGIDFNLSLAASISGTVTSSASGLGVQAQARLHASNGDQLSVVTGAPDGTYTLGGIDPGTYYLLLNNSNGPLIDEVWDNVQCPRLSCDFMTLGTPIIVTATEVLIGYDAALDPGSQISGSVMIDGQPAGEFAEVLFYNSTGTYAGFAFTDASGNFLSRSGFPAGTYYATFGEPQSTTGITATAWPNAACGEPCDPTLGDPIVVNGTDDVGGIDFNLLSLGTASLSGTVVDAADGTTPVHPVDIDLLDPITGDVVGVNTTNNPDGTYALFGAAPGDYKIIFNAFGDAEVFVDELFDEIPCDNGDCDRATLGDVIMLNAGSNTLDEDLEQAPPGPMISGTVTDSGTALPIEGVQIDVQRSDGGFGASASTDVNGNYSIEVPGDGDYFVFTPIYGIPIPYLPDVWDGVDGTYCDFQVCDFTMVGTPITVSGGNVSGIDLALDTGFTISGTVTDASTTNPIDGANVCVHLDTGEWTGSCGGTGGGGGFETFALPPGANYVAYAFADEQGYKRQLWNGIDCDYNNCFFNTGTLIELGSPGSVAGIDFNLSPAASISGTVTDSTTTLGVQPQVRLHALDGTQIGFTVGQPDGTYSLGGIDPGSYYLLLNNRVGPLIDELWDNVQCPRFSCDFMTLGTQITLSAGEMLTGIDAALDPGSRISGSVTIDGMPAPSFGDVLFYNDAGVYAGFGFTDGAGNFISRSGFPAGSYYVTFGEPQSTTGITATAWPNAACGEPCDPTLGDPVVVNGTDDVGGIDFMLTTGGSGMISGTITADEGGAPLNDIRVCASIQSDPGFEECSVTDVTGFYSIGGLVPLTDYVIYTGDVGGQAFFPEQYNEQPCCDPADGTPIDITGGNATIDMSLASSGLITGFVADSLTGLGLPNVRMDLYDAECNRVDLLPSFTDDGSGGAVGQYAISGVPDGTYYVYAQTYINGGPVQYIPELYPNQQRLSACYGDLSEGQAIVIENMTIVNGIDFALDVGGSINGTVSGPEGVLPFRAARIWLYDADNTLINIFQNVNSEDNSYSIFGVPAGSYQILFSSANLGLVDERYNDVPCPRSSCDPALSEPVIVGPLENVTGIDATLEAGAVIEGRLTDAVSGNGLPFQFANVYTDTGQYAGVARSNADGFFTTSTGFPPGDYFFANQLVDPVRDIVLPVDNGYLPQVWTNDGSFRACGDPCNVLLGDPITIIDANPVTGIDLAMEQGATISGSVTTGGVTPLQNIEVQLRNSLDGGIIRTVDTDAAGNYAFDGVGSGTYFLRTFNTQGYSDRLYSGISCNPFCNTLAGTPVVSDGSTSVPGISFDLPAAPAISGVVTDGVNPVASVPVQAFDVLGNLVASATTNALGEYVLSNLYAGDFYIKTALSASSPYVNALYDGLDCLPGCNPLVGTPVAVGASGTVVISDMELGGPSTIEGTVDSGLTGPGPMAGVNVQVYSDTGTLVASVTTDSIGFYQANGLTAGNYYVITRNNFGYVDEGAGGSVCQGVCSPTSTEPVELGAVMTARVDFILEQGGTISGTVRDAITNAPLQGVTVRAWSSAAGPLALATTGPNGTYRIRGLASDTYFIHTTNNLGYLDQLYQGLDCETGCFLPSGTAIVVTQPYTQQFKDFSLEPGGTISGFVTDVNSAGVGGIQVLAWLDGAFRASAFTSGDGSFTINGLVAGDYRLQTSNELGYIDEVRGGDLCSPEPCDINSGAVSALVGTSLANQNISLATGGSISGVATDTLGNPLPTGSAVVFSPTGQFVKQSTITAGSFFINGLANGSYYLLVENGSGLVDQLWQGLPCPGGGCDVTTGTPVVVSGAGASPDGPEDPTGSGIEFELEEGGLISGSVKTAGGVAFQSTMVFFFDADGTPVGRATTDGLGNFVTPSSYPDGTYFAATSRMAIGTDSPELAEAAEAGLSELWQDEAWDGFACDGVCEPSQSSGFGTPIVIAGSDVSDVNFTINQAPGISIEKSTNGIDADTPNGGLAPVVFPGSAITWTYQVTNTGGDVLQSISVVDNQGVVVTCPQNTLAAGESMSCTGFGTAQNLELEPFTGVMGNCAGEPGSRLYQNIATVTAETASAIAVEDSDASHYCNPPDLAPDLIFGGGFE